MRATQRIVSQVCRGGPVALPSAIRLSASTPATWGAAVRCDHLRLLHSRDGNSWIRCACGSLQFPCQPDCLGKNDGIRGAGPAAMPANSEAIVRPLEEQAHA